jgi:hypothetical protein
MKSDIELDSLDYACDFGTFQASPIFTDNGENIHGKYEIVLSVWQGITLRYSCQGYGWGKHFR